ncbi:hypothetical protein JNB88_13975 [Rhizobium cauense]|uniref:hypothetical protein n=1 Tax=Rhizobium cauense TaxID=1166683 RepID=UPI001C6E301B|nr:hypothetical protein [Rhizobium cauense]MBW9114750.1 hypothetical protein [Rhizobium cauense]
MQFIVDEALAGRSDFLKAFTIANSVFDRSTSLDAQNDPVVRIEAGRLRRALELYYLVIAGADRVVVTIPKGGYVPSFNYADKIAPTSQGSTVEPTSKTEFGPHVPTSPAHTVLNPSRLSWIRYVLLSGIVLLAIAAFVQTPHEFALAPPAIPHAAPASILVEQFRDGAGLQSRSKVADGLRDEIIVQLVKFRDIAVIASLATTGEASTEAPRYALQGSVTRVGDRLRSRLRLIQRTDGAAIWASTYDGDLRSRGLFQIQDQAARCIANSLASPYGATFHTNAGSLTKERINVTTDGNACVLEDSSTPLTVRSMGRDGAKSYSETTVRKCRLIRQQSCMLPPCSPAKAELGGFLT